MRLFLLWLLAVSPLFPQATTANVVGAVERDRGPGAGRYWRQSKTVRQIKYEERKPTHKVTTSFRFLQTGEYSISVEKAGFQKAEVASFTLSVDQVARIDVKLSVGQTTESVQVSASAILLQTEDAAVGTVIDSQRLSSFR